MEVMRPLITILLAVLVATLYNCLVKKDRGYSQDGHPAICYARNTILIDETRSNYTQKQADNRLAIVG